MKTVKMFILGFAAIDSVLSVLAADTRDYSTYIKLKSNTTIDDTTGGWPSADKWNPAGEMTDEGYYLIPSGKTLTSWTKNSGPTGGTWPGMELAIQGTFAVNATGGRTKAAVTPHLALLPGGMLSLGNYAYSTVNGTTLDIRGTAENPSSIAYKYATSNNKDNYYPLYIFNY